MTIKSAIILKDEPSQSSDMIEISSIFHWRKLVVVDQSSHEKKREQMNLDSPLVRPLAALARKAAPSPKYSQATHAKLMNASFHVNVICLGYRNKQSIITYVLYLLYRVIADVQRVQKRQMI
jgi:hypothetical protein